MAARKNTKRARTSVFPKTIQNMISRAYANNERASHAAARINNTATAHKLGLTLSTAQVAAAYAWITMRG